MSATYTILLDDMSVAMRLGIHPHETEPQPVSLSVAMTVTYPSAPAPIASRKCSIMTSCAKGYWRWRAAPASRSRKACAKRWRSCAWPMRGWYR